jgi:deoxycytidylate deaminase
MQENRSAHVSSLLTDGKVLIAGGYNTSVHLKSAEIFDSSNETWTSTQNEMSAEHSYGTASLLDNGNVLVVGGWNGNLNLNSCDLYNPSLNSWSVVSSMASSRSDHTATKLQNGKILVVGGYDGVLNLNSCELYDPVNDNWESVASLSTGRSSHTATLLNDGRVLVAGGYNPDANFQLNSTEIYDPISNTWSNGPNMSAGRNQHAACILPNGNVLISGGESFTGQFPFAFEGLTSAEIFNSSTNTFTAASSLPSGLSFHKQIPVGNYVMAISGKEKTDYFDGNFTFLDGKTYLYDMNLNTWTLSELNNDARLYFTANKLLDNRILVCGGGSNSVEIFESNLSIKESDKNNYIAIHPNPANEILNISYLSDEVKEFKLKDVFGRDLGIFITDSNLNPTIDVSSFTSGIYFIEFKVKNEVTTLKFIKE